MAFNLDKLSEIAKSRSEEAIEKAQRRKAGRGWLHMSQDIALSLRYYLRKMNMTQKEFAEKMGVSPAYVGKLLKGQENLTLESICNIQEVINRDLVSIYRPYEYNTLLSVSPIAEFKDVKRSDVYSSKQSISTGYSPISGDAA